MLHHIRFAFFTTISTSKKRSFFFFSERDQERDTLTIATLSGLQSDCEIGSNCGKKKVPGLTYGEPCTPLPPFCFVIKAEIRATLIPGMTERNDRRKLTKLKKVQEYSFQYFGRGTAFLSSSGCFSAKP